MNNQRRKTLADLQARTAELVSLAEDLVSEIESVRDEEQEYLDNMPDSLREGDKAQAAQDAIGEMESALDALNSLVDGSPADALEGAAA